MLPCNCLIRFSCYLYVNKGWTGTIRRNDLRFSSQTVILGRGELHAVAGRGIREEPGLPLGRRGRRRVDSRT